MYCICLMIPDYYYTEHVHLHSCFTKEVVFNTWTTDKSGNVNPLWTGEQDGMAIFRRHSTTGTLEPCQATTQSCGTYSMSQREIPNHKHVNAHVHVDDIRTVRIAEHKMISPPLLKQIIWATLNGTMSNCRHAHCIMQTSLVLLRLHRANWKMD